MSELHEEREHVLALVDAMKLRGVRSFKSGRIEVVFDAPEAPPMKDSKTVAELDSCVCGHGLHAHNNGLCLQGCDPEKCLPAEAKS